MSQVRSMAVVPALVLTIIASSLVTHYTRVTAAPQDIGASPGTVFPPPPDPDDDNEVPFDPEEEARLQQADQEYEAALDAYCREHRYDPFCEPAEDPQSQNEDVIPVHGDSSGTVDEVMEDARTDRQPAFLSQLTPRGAWALNSLVVPATSAPAVPSQPIIIAISRGNGSFELRRYSRDGFSPRVIRAWSRRQLVMSPVAPGKQRAFEKQIAAISKRGSGTHITHIALNGYCVDAKKAAAPAGRLYLVAPAATREQYAPMRMVRRVADFAAARGFLRPQGDPAAYGRSIAQYAIWTKLEHWNEMQFTDEFVRRSKDTITREHKPWSADTEKTLRALAPHRWKEIDTVIRTAAQLDSTARAQGKGGAR